MILKKILEMIYCRLLNKPKKVYLNEKVFLMKYDFILNSINEGRWEKEIFQYLDDYLKPKDIFVDVGAWNGVISFYASKICKQCFSVEPDTKAIEWFKENIRLNKSKNIILNEFGFANHNGRVKLYSPSFGKSISSVFQNKGFMKEEWIKVKTFQEFLNINKINKIDFIKMDIEGAEFEIFPTMIKYCNKYKPKLFVSLHLKKEIEDKKISNTIELFKIYSSFIVENEIMNFKEIKNKILKKEPFDVLCK